MTQARELAIAAEKNNEKTCNQCLVIASDSRFPFNLVATNRFVCTSTCWQFCEQAPIFGHVPLAIYHS